MRKILVVVLMLVAVAGRAQDTKLQLLPVAVKKEVLTISGTLTDAASHKPAAGVRLQVSQFSAAITDADGKYTLKVPSYDAVVLISGEGYGNRQEALKGRKVLNLQLLDESATTSTNQVTLPTGSVFRINTPASVQQLEVNGWSQPDEMPDALLQGRVAGLQVIRRSGMYGAGASLFLRGYNSLYATNKPLIVVDGMIYDDNEYGNSLVANTIVNPLSLIDAKDIDNISILKDASSIYGTKGANGAIIITTAHTTDPATKISFGSYSGFSEAPESLPVMDAHQYRSYLNDVLKSRGLTSTQIDAMPFMNDNPAGAGYYTYHYNTDWQRKVLQNSYTSNYYLKVTGGDNIATYGLSMGYMKNPGVLKATDLSRYNTRFNAEFNFSKKFTGFANLSFAYNEQNLKDQGIADKTSPLFLALTKAPFLDDHDVNEQGIVSPNLSDVDILGKSNPTSVISQMQAYNKYYRFFGSFGFKYDISKSISATTAFGIVYDKIRENIFVPGKGVAKDTLANAIANNRLGTQVKRLFSFYNDSKIEYNSSFSATNHLSARLGMRFQKNSAEQDYALGFNSATDELVSVQNGISALRQIGGGIGQWNWLNIYAGADYDYNQKYFLSLSAAADGSSRFGIQAPNGLEIAGRKFPLLPSVGLAWLLSSENFMAESPLNLLKIRASLSYTGNDDIGNSSTRQTYVAQSLLGMQGLVRSGVANPALQWETVRKQNLALDMAFANNRVNLSVEAYKNHTDNMLVYESLPTATGYTNLLTNGGAMNNEGIEATINLRLVQRPKLKWDLGFNIGQYKNTVQSVPGGNLFTQLAGATLLTSNGNAASQFYGFKTLGIFNNAIEASQNGGLQKRNADGSLTYFQAGDVRFVDMNKDKIIDDNDRVIIGNPNPDFYGGINSNLYWGKFTIAALVTFSKGNDVYNYTRYRLESVDSYNNQLQSAVNRWRGEGHQATLPRANWGDPMGNNRFSDRWIEDGSYLRLKSLSVNYQLPLKSTVLNDINIYLVGTNLLTLTKYKGFDPEFSGGSSVFAQGIDTGLYPQFRNLTLGFRFGL